MSASAASASTPHRIGMAYPIPSHSQNSTAAVTANDPAREPRKKALLIGSKYIYTARDEQGTSKSSPEIPCSTDQADGCLHSPCRDVYRWKTLLLKSFRFAEENIHVLVDEEADCPHVRNARDAIGTAHQHDPRLRPKRANIKRELRELVKNAIPGDQLFFFFAGHVGQVDCKSDTEEDGQDEGMTPSRSLQMSAAIVPADDLERRCNWLKDNELKKILVDGLPTGVQLVCIVDACHSATLFDLPHSRCNTTKIDDSQIERTFVTGFTSPASRTSLQDVSRRTSSYPRRSATMEAGATSDCKAVSLRKDSVSATVSQDGNVPVRRASSSSATSHDASLYAGAVEDFARGFFPPSRQMSAASETICESPTQVMPGEVPDETCGEGCRVDPDFKGPVVVTISACQDDQEAWEHKRDGGSLTKVLVPFFEKNANRTYREIMERLRDALDGIVHNEHEKFRRRSPAQARRRSYIGPTYQDPQLCSSTPLDLDQIFVLSRPA